VLGVRCTHCDAADSDFVSGLYLDDVFEAVPPQQGADSTGYDEHRSAGDPPERREVEVVVVDMGDQDCIDAERIEPGCNSDSTQMEHPRTDHRIGQQADPVQLEEHGAVAEP
jgi:hypothetical protein